MNSALTALTRAAHVVRRLQLHQREADHDAHHVGRAQHEQRRQRQGQPSREAEHDGGEAEKRSRRANSTAPTLRVSGKRASTTDMLSAPSAGAARNKPRPHGPVMQDIARVDRQQRNRAAEQHGEQIERQHAEQQAPRRDEGEARE